MRFRRRPHLHRVNTLAATLALAACSPGGGSGAEAPAPALASAPRAARVLAWTPGPVLPRGRDHHVTFIVPARDGSAQLHVAGGTDYRGVFNDVWRLPLARTGEPAGAWTEAGTLPARRAGQGVVTDGRHVVLVGGQDSTLRKVTDVWTAAVDADGNLGTWSVGPSLPSPRFHHAMVLHRGWIYALGGLERQTSVDTGYRAPFRDGVVGAWQPLPPTPEPRSHHSAFVVGDTLYLLGGLNGNPAGKNVPLGSIVAATIARDGSLGPWRATGQIAPTVATHASAVAHGVVWTVGGVEDNARFSRAVWRAEAGGALPAEAWARDSAGLAEASSHVHQMPVFAGRLFRVGGGSRRVVTGQTLMAPVE
jgi:hypothetical protein